MRVFLFLGVTLGTLLASCQQRETEPVLGIDPKQYEYYPLKIGAWKIYQVDSVVFDFGPGGGTIRDSSSIQVLERIIDTIYDNTGVLVYNIERSLRTNNSAPWVIVETFTASLNKNQAVRTERNFRFLKLVFPMTRRTEWNGNIWIDESREIEIAGERMRPFSNWHYEVDSIDVPAVVGAFAFDSTLLVTEADDENVIERRLSQARYANHVGLVWREQWILDSQYCNQTPPPADCETRPWEQKAERGYILRQTIIAFQ